MSRLLFLIAQRGPTSAGETPAPQLHHNERGRSVNRPCIGGLTIPSLALSEALREEIVKQGFAFEEVGDQDIRAGADEPLPFSLVPAVTSDLV